MPATLLPAKPVYPRPPVVRDHAELFRAAVYEDGQPYGQDDGEDEDPAIITP